MNRLLYSVLLSKYKNVINICFLLNNYNYNIKYYNYILYIIICLPFFYILCVMTYGFI